MMMNNTSTTTTELDKKELEENLPTFPNPPANTEFCPGELIREEDDLTAI